MRHVDVVALLGAVAWLLLIIEMVRRRRFSEGYSLLWLLSGVALVMLSIWRELLNLLAQVMGIAYPPTALLVIAIGCMLLLIVQQSAVICRLERRESDLAQHIAILSMKLERLAERQGIDTGQAVAPKVE